MTISSSKAQALQEQFRKIAFGEGMGGEFSHALTTGVAGALATAGIAGATVAASKIYDAVTKNRDFRGMLQSPFNADLQSHYESKPKEFNAAFSSLRTLNPEFSKDPMVAGTYMRRMMTYDPGSAGGLIVESLQHRKNFESPVQEAAISGGREGAKAGIGTELSHRQSEASDSRRAASSQQQALLQHMLQQRGGGNRP